eukprot:TRINITY_DN7262_c0_g1_i5.p1 TRINITY_DN7262_c0_g1~~TRINITY_DN7262_c0_g1_i5.p1  ORF type:complete len:117 (+),score=24.86 TRINITY_DN7262_c0_g1_i5:138-488(+)
MAELYSDNILRLGVVLPGVDEQQSFVLGSTDMGNVSYVVPTIHPWYKINSEEGNHTEAFTKASSTKESHDVTWLASKAMCFTGVDLLVNKDGVMDKVKEEFMRVHGPVQDSIIQSM